MSRSKYFCFTINNYTKDELDQLRRLESGSLLTYLICGIERGAGGTPHLQGYLEVPTRQRFSGVCKIPGLGRAHLETRKGNSKQAAEYCRKEGDFFEVGEISQVRQGKRTDLDDAIEDIKAGCSTSDLWNSHSKTMVRNSRGLLELWGQLKAQREVVTFPLDSFTFSLDFCEGTSHVVIGPSGCGKTSYARSCFPKALFCSHMDDLGKFDADRHEAIIFDDMGFSHMPRTAQIHLVDWDDDRSIHIRYKTAFIPRGTMKVFTSNTDDVFDLYDAAIKRRVTVHRVD